jgi:hypothetical protein
MHRDIGKCAAITTAAIRGPNSAIPSDQVQRSTLDDAASVFAIAAAESFSVPQSTRIARRIFRPSRMRDIGLLIALHVT